MFYIIRNYFSFLYLFLAVFYCFAVPSAKKRLKNANSLAEKSEWHQIIIETPVFDIASYIPDNIDSSKQTLTIYIEGDGLSWITGSRVSPNPTPVKPLALLLALKHPDNHAAYLARPYQYINSNKKIKNSRRYWSNACFSEEVIESMNSCINKLKNIFKAKELYLVGFSGGGTVAALISARRNDVSLLVTLVANLNHPLWTKHHQIRRLDKSQNPVEKINLIYKIPQIHFTGEKDKIVPSFIVSSFLDLYPDLSAAKMIIIPDVAHNEGWEKKWPDIIQKEMAGNF